MIASDAKALAIIEATAKKHGLTIAELMAVPFKRATVLARGEVVSRLNEELRWSFERIAAYLGCVPSTAHSAKSEWKKAQGAFIRFIPNEAALALATIGQSEAHQRAMHAESQLRALQGELTRVAGVELSERLVEEFKLLPRAAILLAIVIEAYPRHVREAAILQLYDEACVRLSYGYRTGATRELNLQNVRALRLHFAEHGWPNPIEVGSMPGSRVLTADAAQWLHDRMGSPLLSQIVRHKERAMA